MSLSRIARKPVTFPSTVDIQINEHSCHIKGPKGHCTLPIHPSVKLVVENLSVKVVQNENIDSAKESIDVKLVQSIPGTIRANLYNAVHGVTQGFERKLVLVGVGYRAQIKGKILLLSLGYSHPIEFPVSEGITIETPSQTEILIKGINKNEVGRVAAQIRELRAPEPYKGKGIRFSDETIILKETKKK